MVQGMNRESRGYPKLCGGLQGDWPLWSMRWSFVGKMELRLMGRQGLDHKLQGLDGVADFSLQTQGKQDPSTRVGENLLSERRAYKSQADCEAGDEGPGAGGLVGSIAGLGLAPISEGWGLQE